MPFALISAPTFVIALHTTSSRSLSLTEEGMPVILRHSCLEYWAFVQHCLSRAINFSLKELISILEALKSDFRSSTSGHFVLKNFALKVDEIYIEFIWKFIWNVSGQVLMISETKIDESFPKIQFLIKDLGGGGGGEGYHTY